MNKMKPTKKQMAVELLRDYNSWVENNLDLAGIMVAGLEAQYTKKKIAKALERAKKEEE